MSNVFKKGGNTRFSALRYDMARIVNSPFYGTTPTFGGLIELTPQDQLLISQGQGGLRSLDLYFNLLSDSKVYACLDKIVQEIVSRDYIVKPANNTPIARHVAAYFTDLLQNLGAGDDSDHTDGKALANTNATGYDMLTKALCFAYVTGLQPAEITYDYDKQGKVTVRNVRPKDPRRFRFYSDEAGNIYPKLLTSSNTYDGVFLPPRKFIMHTYWAIPNDDPYGSGVGRNLYYPVNWKREAFTYWLTVLDRYSEPIAVGKAPISIDDELVTEFRQFLQSISRETSVVLPEGWDMEFKDPNVSGAVEMLTSLIEFCDKYTALTILGEAVTGEQVGNAYGGQREEISNSIRIMKASAISKGIDNTINNTLIKWVTYFRYGDMSLAPTVSRVFEEKANVSEWIDNAVKLKELGYELDTEQVKQVTGFNIMEPKAEEPAAPTTAISAPKSSEAVADEMEAILAALSS